MFFIIQFRNDHAIYSLRWWRSVFIWASSMVSYFERRKQISSVKNKILKKISGPKMD